MRSTSTAGISKRTLKVNQDISTLTEPNAFQKDLEKEQVFLNLTQSKAFNIFGINRATSQVKLHKIDKFKAIDATNNNKSFYSE